MNDIRIGRFEFRLALPYHNREMPGFQASERGNLQTGPQVERRQRSELVSHFRDVSMKGLIELEIWKHQAPDRAWEIRSKIDAHDGRSTFGVSLKDGQRRYLGSVSYSSDVPEIISLTIDRLCAEALKGIGK